MGFDKAHKMAQRLHRERRQPAHRHKFGYLEKKADYKKRAIDHQIKASRLKRLKQKALERNPNEFNFHMINSRLNEGVHEEIVRPMEAGNRERQVKKEQLLKRYNSRLLNKRAKAESQQVELATASEPGPSAAGSGKRKHIKFL